MGLVIRAEAAGDHVAVSAVNERAFGQPHEARLVERLRDRVSPCVSLVAERDGRVVGHAFFTPVVVESDRGDRPSMALGPVAVDPDHQGRGIGAALIRRGLEVLEESGHDSVFVLGHPSYYPRFGFRPAAECGIRCGIPVPAELFFVRELRPGGLHGMTGTVHYHGEFAALEDAAEDPA